MTDRQTDSGDFIGSSVGRASKNRILTLNGKGQLYCVLDILPTNERYDLLLPPSIKELKYVTLDI